MKTDFLVDAATLHDFESVGSILRRLYWSYETQIPADRDPNLSPLIDDVVQLEEEAQP